MLGPNSLITSSTPSPLNSKGRFSAIPRPFLRWVGSKQALLGQVDAALPDIFGKYFEPFLGGGALFFHLKPKNATLSDQSSELIQVWKSVRDDCDGIIEYLRPLKPDKELFYRIRENRSTDQTIRSAEFLYLNKTCWNGLYRVNSKGKFNVPYGRPRSNFIFDETNLRACSKILNKNSINIELQDFATSTSKAEAGDLVYFDPPYVNKHNNNGFRDWSENLFSWHDQERLAAEARRLAQKGACVVVSNADHKEIRDLYEGFNILRFERSSTLSSSAQFRGKVGEIIAVLGGKS